METSTSIDSKGWRGFLRKHWRLLALFIVAGVSTAVGAVYVFLWFVASAQGAGLVPKTMGLWTMAHGLTFLLNLVFWELVLVGIPVIIASLVGWWWWRSKPALQEGCVFEARREGRLCRVNEICGLVLAATP